MIFKEEHLEALAGAFVKGPHSVTEVENTEFMRGYRLGVLHGRDQILDQLCDVLKKDNPRFKKDNFLGRVVRLIGWAP